MLRPGTCEPVCLLLSTTGLLLCHQAARLTRLLRAFFRGDRASSCLFSWACSGPPKDCARLRLSPWLALGFVSLLFSLPSSLPLLVDTGPLMDALARFKGLQASMALAVAKSPR